MEPTPTSNLRPSTGAHTGAPSATGEILVSSSDDAPALASRANSQMPPLVRIDIVPASRVAPDQPTAPPPPTAPSFVHPTRIHYFLTLSGVAVLAASTILMFSFIRSAKSHHKAAPCLQLRDDRKGACRAARILLQVSGIALFVFGFFLLQMSVEIRKLSWVNQGNRKSSVILFLFALALSNFPTFITPHTSYGYWCSTAYHVYFLVVETILAVRTNTNLHSTFASINLTCGCVYLLTDHRAFLRWLWPSLVLILAGLGHMVSYFWIGMQQTLPQEEEPSIFTQNPFSMEFWRKMVQHGFWVVWLAPSMFRFILWENEYFTAFRARLMDFCCIEISTANVQMEV